MASLVILASHEYLDYAQANRNEWVNSGKQKVADYLAKYKEMHPADEDGEAS